MVKMTRRYANLLLPTLFLLLTAGAAAGAAKKPNIIIILADDLGYGDLSVQGHPLIRTPNLDQLAREGQRWTSFYSSAPICGPSRVALMTGRMTYRMTSDSKNSWIMSLPSSEVTLGEMLKGNNYETAYIGKWGLSPIGPYEHDRTAYGVRDDSLKREHYQGTDPNSQGFDYFFGLSGSNDPLPADVRRTYASIKNSTSTGFPAPLYRQKKIIESPADQPTLTKRYTEESVNWINSRKNSPFLLFLSYNAPHVPIFRSKNFEDISHAGPYGDVIEEIDWSVGQIVNALKKNNMADKTLIFFSSDNGPWLTYFDLGGSPGPFRDGKMTTWEGGFRVPAIFWWPGKIKPSVVNGIGVNVDLMKTFATITGASLPRDRALDSLDLSATLLNGNPSPRKEWFFYGTGGDLAAVRLENYKLVFETVDSTGYEEQPCRGYGNYTTHSPPLLFDLSTDPAERHNIAAQNLHVVEHLQKTVEKHRKSIGKPAVATDSIAKITGCEKFAHLTN